MVSAEIIERVGSTAVLRLPVPGFEQLTTDEKLAAYHLSMACIIGDSITWDQSYKYGLELRDLFFELAMHNDSLGVGRDKIIEYTKKLILHHGNHDAWSTKKFVPEFTREELKDALGQARKAGANLRVSALMEKVIFDPEFEVMLTQKSPPAGEDIITASHNNYYRGLSLKDLQGFDDKNPNNSTVVKESGKIVEKVWRAGSASHTPGLYARELKRICEHLELAIKHSGPDEKKHLSLLKQYFEEGTAHLYDDYNIAWVKTNPAVDQILGFVEEYRDTRGKKGLFEGMTFIVDKETTKLITKIASVSDKLEEEAPWKQEYKKHWDKIPVANAISLIIGTGGGGPFCWAGVNLPNSQLIRQKHGSKSIILSNVTSSTRDAFSKQTLEEFYERKEEIEAILKYLAIKFTILVTLHEIVGHGSGKASDKLKGDPRDHLREYYSTMEEARAELCALHHCASPTLMELGVIPDEGFWKNAYLGYATAAITGLKAMEHDNEIHEDHHRATQLIVEYLRRKVGAVEFYKKNDKTYARIDAQKMKAGVAELLSELQRTKSEGDYAGIKALVDEYGVQFDKALRDEVIARNKRIGLPANTAFVMPIPVLEETANGQEVKLAYPKSLLDQGMQWKKIGF